MKQAVNRRPRVLVIAYECSPVRGHAPGAAWQFVSRLAEKFDVHVVTEERQYRSEIEAHFRAASESCSTLKFSFIPGRPKKYSWRPVLPIRSMFEYRRWHDRTYQVARMLHASEPFDLVHLLRSNSFREPGLCWKLPVPFIWGPFGGTNYVPTTFLVSMSPKDAIVHIARRAVNWLQLRGYARVRRALKGAAAIISQSSDDARRLSRAYGISPIVIHEQNCQPSAKFVVRQYAGERKIRVVWPGQFVARKGFPLLIDALAKCKNTERIEVTVAGNGPLRDAWRSHAEKRGVGKQIRWLGWVESGEMQKIMTESDLMVFTSYLEGTSAAVMEALSSGLPIVALRSCGHADVLDESCGALIDGGSYSGAVEQLAQVLDRYVEVPDLVEAASRCAFRRAVEFSWDAAAERVAQLYWSAVSRSV